MGQERKQVRRGEAGSQRGRWRQGNGGRKVVREIVGERAMWEREIIILVIIALSETG